MKLLEERILKDGRALNEDVLKVDGFLNHQMDIELFNEMGKEWYRLFQDEQVNKILTIEASGIGMACVAAQYFHCPVVFAKKSKTRNLSGEFYTTQVASFTHGVVNHVIVAKPYLNPEDRVLIIDDFLANGAALEGLMDLVQQAGDRGRRWHRCRESLPARRRTHPGQRSASGVPGTGEGDARGRDRILLTVFLAQVRQLWYNIKLAEC